MGILGEGGLIPGFQGIEVGVNSGVEGRVFLEVESRVGLPRCNGGGLLGPPQDR